MAPCLPATCPRGACQASGLKSVGTMTCPSGGCQPLQVALDTWGEVSFNYSATDTPDVVATPTA